MEKIRFLSGNAVKILAAILMVVDHVGFFLFPDLIILRIIGRVSFPLFAYMLAEGCRYTKNKTQHFVLLFGLALLCQIVIFFFDNGNIAMSVLVTFSLSVLMIYALQFCKKCFLQEACPLSLRLLSLLLFAAAVAGTWGLNEVLVIDYGFVGCLLPVFPALFDFKDIPMPEKTAILAKLDNLYVRLACLAVGIALLPLGTDLGALEYYAFFALIPLLFYSGKRGKLRMKYFFYIFYPLHIALLQGLAMLL